MLAGKQEQRLQRGFAFLWGRQPWVWFSVRQEIWEYRHASTLPATYLPTRPGVGSSMEGGRPRGAACALPPLPHWLSWTRCIWVSPVACDPCPCLPGDDGASLSLSHHVPVTTVFPSSTANAHQNVLTLCTAVCGPGTDKPAWPVLMGSSSRRGMYQGPV